MKRIKIYFFLIILITFAGCNKENDSYQGYVDGDLRYITVNYPGVLIDLYVKRGEKVNRGTKLFALEKNPELDSLQEAEAKYRASQEEVDKLTEEVSLNKKKLERRITLKSQNATHQEEVDTAASQYKQSNDQLMEANAVLQANLAIKKRTEWTLNKKEIFANISGIVYDTYYKPGEYVMAGRPVLSLLGPEDVKILFYVPETLISQIKLNQKVIVTCDGCRPINAVIAYISPKAEFTPPIIYSEQTRSKLVFLIEARMDTINSQKLPLGLPVSVYLH